MKLYEIPAGMPGFRQQFDVIPDREFLLPGGGRVELMFGQPGNGQRALIHVYDGTNKLVDTVPATVLKMGAPTGNA